MSVTASKRETEISLSEVSMHDTIDDCWVVLFNKVYDVTDFIQSHPGGAEVLLEQAGRDATLAFQQAGHQSVSNSHLEPYRLGTLPKAEWFDLELILKRKRNSFLEPSSLSP
ncbi:hypothetical protein GE061_016029 [Apolygus lucorum]|uniref:Cytochrome b5 heme-binding domain-containing protein n=1 Tax=Apolygus lucorum TaxID=248454 RepID=A0A8S9XEZ3_APOLU|nr:hypothetical protein GE061_016029 [Apolygus lucorum]